MQDIQSKLTKIKVRISQKVSYPYLHDYVSEPIVDEDKLLILVSIMDQLHLSMDEMENYIVTAMLIQMALDTHENVQTEEYAKAKHRNQKKQQLTVLAGDYYSGLYYKLLSEMQNIPMIGVLAGGIKDVNEHKIAVHQKDADGLDKLMYSIKMIEAALFERLTDYFSASIWNDVTSNLLLIKRLLTEKNQFLHTGTSLVFDALEKLIFPAGVQKAPGLSKEQRNCLLLTCDRSIDFYSKAIENGMKKLPFINELLKQRVFAILNQHQSMAKTCVEEG